MLLHLAQDPHEDEDRAGEADAGTTSLGGRLVGCEGVDEAVNDEVGHCSLRDGWERANSLKFS